MFLGQYEHAIDGKGRLIIPARYRELLSSGAYISQGFDQNLMVQTTDNFLKLAENVSLMSVTDPRARLLHRLIFGSAEILEVDKTGRILIPSFLRQQAHLSGNAVIVGMGTHFEVWAPDLWAPFRLDLSDGDANAQRFSDLNLPIH
jgi:MraZ protein